MSSPHEFLLSIIFVLCLKCILINGVLFFPKGFKFGVATSAYQIEGAWNVADKSESIWDHFTHTKSHLIRGGQNGDVACDSYHLYMRDVEMLKELGVDFYRFSISWTRLLPTGFTNYVSQDGLRYYNNLINALIENNIEPVITLYHWDLPQKFQEMGGWTNPLMIQYFEDYARFVFKNFGFRVKVWITFNEPKVFCVLGYGADMLAPGMNYTGIAEYQCVKNVLLAHATVYHMYKREFASQQKGKLSMTCIEWIDHSSDDFAEFERDIQLQLGMVTHPVYSKEGGFPTLLENIIRKKSESQNHPRSRFPQLTSNEKNFIRGTYDYFGLNYYSTIYNYYEYRVDENNRSKPKGLRSLLNYIRQTYDNPEVMIMESGFSDYGSTSDSYRVEYIYDYLKIMLEAIEDGCNVTRYTYWSLMDNFQWMSGYSLDFGLYSVNFYDPKKTRVPKDSVGYYSHIIKNKMIPDTFN